MAAGLSTFIKTLIFSALFYQFVRSHPVVYQDEEIESDPNILIRDKTPPENKDENVCLTEECASISSSIKDAIDETVKPCDDFYDYACGEWLKKNPIPNGKLQISAFTELRDKNNKIMQESLVQDDALNDILPIKKVRTFFQSCLNVKAIDELGSEPIKKYIKDLDSWAVDKKAGWDSKNWDVFETLKKIQKRYTSTNLFFTVESVPDPLRNETKGRHIFMIDKAPLDLHPMFFLVSPKIVRLLFNYMTNVTHLTGVDHDFAKESMKDVIKFEAALAMLSFNKGKVGKHYARVPIRKLEKSIPQFPWFDHLKSLVHPNKITRDDPILILATPYLPTIFKLLKKTDKRVLSNFMVWRMIKSYVPMLGNDFRRMYSQLKGVRESRAETCYSYTSKILSNLLGSLFIRKRFSPKVKSDVQEMMNDIVQAFKDNAQYETWLSGKSRKAVEMKLKNVLSKVGYPDYLWNEQDLNLKYENLDIQTDQWFQNVVNSQKYLNFMELHNVGTIVDKKHWIAPPQMVNAFYVLTRNEIVIPAGILQEPFFYSGSIPKALSYGAVGHVLGHELTHGFDDSGRSFNKFGKKVFFNETGWSKISDKNFKKEAKCLVKQFSQYKVLGKHHVNGKMTLGENIADAGGLKLAYNAYHRWINDHGKEKVLPDLDMNSDELFFIGFAQKSCANTSKVGQFMAVHDDDHAPAKFRVNGALSNMPEFSKTFNCPANSKMNPKTKCDVW
ncbi:neprilysin-4-like [Dendronephthya gigantea]|uniref:neprilysin-4-like n=1 Tax=Dendronephthya gigantea TaxID=151771 RepID=UPI00106DCBF4|nr:neprilysin-4-like [Dendronephthya gigantea]